MINEFKLLHPLNACSPMEVALSGIMIEVRLLHPEKVLFAI